MSKNKDHIWNKVEGEVQRERISKKFVKRNIAIKRVDKEKALNNNYVKSSKTPTFIKKKKGRKKKGSNDHRSHDKFSDDNMKRKVKTHFHNYIIALLNNELEKNPQNEKKMRFGKMNSKITQNITIGYNRILFEKKIKDIIVEISDKYQNKSLNIECISYIMNNQKDNEELIKYLNMTYEDMYINLYLKSTKESFTGPEEDESYEGHKEKFKQLFGEFYLKKYIKNAENLINFYKTSKQRKPRKITENSLDGIDSKLSKSEKKKYNGQLNYSNNVEPNINLQDNKIEKIFLEQNKVSSSTQTDTKFTDDESD